MDGGLFCQFSNTYDDPGFSIIVFNPIGDTLREIPCPPAHMVPEPPWLNLVVDSAAQQFKVLLINDKIREHSFDGDHGFRYIECPLVSIFDSATNEWRSLSNPPGLASEWRYLSCESFVMFQGLVYACFGQRWEGFDTNFQQGIWRCSPVENAWEVVKIYSSTFEHVHMMNSSAFDNVDKEIWSWTLSAPMLFVSADRLFFMAWIADGLEYRVPWRVPWILKVSEITASGMARERLFEMSKSDVMDVFAVKCEDDEDLPEILASGCGNSLLFMSISSGKLMVLDLETLEWEMVPQIPVEASQRDEFCTFHGKHMNLILPSTLWWQEGQGNAV